MSRHVTEAVTLQTYTLELIGPPLQGRFTDRIKRNVLDETEENLTDLLPTGYSVRIREWDAEKEHPHE